MGANKGGRIATRGRLTSRRVATLKVGESAADPAARGAGVLQVRRLANGPTYYYRYTAPDGGRVRIPLGTGLELSDARRLADALSRRYQSGERDLRASIDADRREAHRQQEAEARAAEAEVAAKRATLGALLTGYVAQLEREGKASAIAVRRALWRNVHDAWPVLWMTPAGQVTPDDLLAVVAKPADSGKLREAAKLRAYLRAAYAAAVRARQDARALPELRELRVSVNPARDLVTIEGASQIRQRALSVAELRAYWRRLQSLPDPGGALLRFHLLTGGQRIEQLARATTDDLDYDLQVVRLLDTKGRRRQARPHDVPLIEPAFSALRVLLGGTLGPYVFTVNAGESGAAYATVQHRLRAVVEAMAAAGELEKGPFTVGDLRRTVETRLAAEGIGMDIRAQLQSHGLSGVQSRHYDRHDYLFEKRKALGVLHRLLVGASAKVTPIRKAKGNGRRSSAKGG